jgi:glutathione synthase/RimK-type ligase-like ATP-grasp enzyme
VSRNGGRSAKRARAWRLARLDRQGVHVLNGSSTLFAAHEKLSAALFPSRAGVEQRRTAPTTHAQTCAVLLAQSHSLMCLS